MKRVKKGRMKVKNRNNRCEGPKVYNPNIKLMNIQNTLHICIIQYGKYYNIPNILIVYEIVFWIAISKMFIKFRFGVLRVHPKQTFSLLREVKKCKILAKNILLQSKTLREDYQKIASYSV